MEAFLSSPSIHEELKSKSLHPLPGQAGFTSPKADGKKRPLGIPTLKDRVVANGGRADNWNRSLRRTSATAPHGLTQSQAPSGFAQHLRVLPISASLRPLCWQTCICTGFDTVFPPQRTGPWENWANARPRALRGRLRHHGTLSRRAHRRVDKPPTGKTGWDLIV